MTLNEAKQIKEFLDKTMEIIEETPKDDSLTDADKHTLAVLHIELNTLNKYMEIKDKLDEISNSAEKLEPSEYKSRHNHIIKSKQIELMNMILMPQIETILRIKQYTFTSSYIEQLQKNIIKKMKFLVTEYRQK